MSRERSYGYECYLDIAEELSDPGTREEFLAGEDIFEDDALNAAKDWAKKNKKRWPPKPRTTGWEVRVWSI